MNWFTVVLMLIPRIKNIIKEAEKFFDSVPDSGVQKKEYSIAILKELGIALTGLGDDEFDKLWVHIEGTLSYIIDLLCGILFSHK